MKIGGNNTKKLCVTEATPTLFSSALISFNILPLERSQCLLESIFYGGGGGNYKYLKFPALYLLTGLSNKKIQALF